MTKTDMLKNPNSSENETMNAQRATVWKEGKGWVEMSPSLERKLQDVSESYADKSSNSRFYFVLGKIFPTVYSVYVNPDGTVRAADEPNLSADYIRRLPKCDNPLQKPKAGA